MGLGGPEGGGEVALGDLGQGVGDVGGQGLSSLDEADEVDGDHELALGEVAFDADVAEGPEVDELVPGELGPDEDLPGLGAGDEALVVLVDLLVVLLVLGEEVGRDVVGCGRGDVGEGGQRRGDVLRQGLVVQRHRRRLRDRDQLQRLEEPFAVQRLVVRRAQQPDVLQHLVRQLRLPQEAHRFLAPHLLRVLQILHQQPLRRGPPCPGNTRTLPAPTACTG